MKPTAATLSAVLLTVLSVTASAQPPAGTLAGKVFADTTLRPIGEAEVMLPEIGTSVQTDAKGAFRIENLPVGRYTVRARHVGFVPYEGIIEVRKGDAEPHAIVLPRFTVLDSLRVVGNIDVPVSFLEHRALGLGHFLTRADLEKQANARPSALLAMIPGLGMVFGKSSQGWIMSKRYTAPISSITARRTTDPLGHKVDDLGSDLYMPDNAEQRAGIVKGCYARVYLNHSLLNPGTPAEPVDVNQFLTQSIAAIEWFEGPAQTPNQYSRLNANCGVLVIHTRRD